MCCARLARNAGPKKSKIRHLGTIAQHLSGYILATKGHMDNEIKTCLTETSPAHVLTIWWTSTH